MPRPCRPVSAAVFAALLLATAALWVRGAWRCDTVYLFRWGRLWSAEAGAGELAIWVSRDHRPAADRSDAFEYHAFDTEERVGARPFWFHLDTSRPGIVDVTAPMWSVALLAALGLWWSWRGRKPKAGFPVEGIAKT